MLMDMREQEDGRSEGRLVMGRIGIEARADIIPRESGLTSIGSIFTREYGEPLKEGKQMKAEKACAPSGRTVDWRQIEWHKVYQKTRRLQARIVKATQEGRWGKVRALQHLLTHSYSGKVLAVRRVTENQGKRTPGVDDVTWPTPEAKSTAMMSLKQRGYNPMPLRRIYIPKAKGGKRPISIPTMTDRAMQALYLLALQPIAETTADSHSFGFRTARSTADAIENCFIQLGKTASAQWILEGDIKGCFDNISHAWLLDNIPMDRSILRKWLKAGFMELGSFNPTDAGTPQGGIVSPVLANMALDGLQTLLKRTFRPRRTRIGGKRVEHCPKVNYVRYADDFVITGCSKELLEDQVKPLVREFLKIRGLELSEEKTKITHVEEGFDFLGWNVRKYGNKLLIKPSKENVKRFLRKVRKIIGANKAIGQADLIKMLNPVLRGWANYHRHAVSSETFSKVGHAIWQKLWQWSRRRHPNKGGRWVKNRYFRTEGRRTWVFAASGEVKGRTVIYRLHDIHKTKIVRHTKIREDANPFDRKWGPYFEQRTLSKLLQGLEGRKVKQWILRKQKGICPVCRQMLVEDAHEHHIVKRVHGGDKMGVVNLILVHETCHNQLHSQGNSVVEPVAAGEGGGFDRLEPYEVKISRTVLRGLGSGDTAWLPD
ncbi:MAG: group II intron reverse transcriptase/maturase, partial [Syntrophorhabdales bacterium]